MKQRFLVLLLAIGLLVVLVVLNALTYVQKQTEADSEFKPNRSTFNPAATGTQAFYTLLLETGRKPIRWQDSPEGLITSRSKPSVFVMIGAFRRPITEEEGSAILRWVSQGGRLVLIDRDPPKDLCTSTANWKIEVSSDPAVQYLSVDPSDQNAMTSNTLAARPIHPSLFTAQVNAVQPSMFAGWVSFERYLGDVSHGYGAGNPPPAATRLFQWREQPSPPAAATPEDEETGESDKQYEPGEAGPVVHIIGREKNLLVDVPYGAGRIVYLTDPYIVSNGGINIVDNAQLALNLVATSGGTVAFDEYHQGYGTNANRLFQYFEGTPVIAIFVQCSLLIVLLFISQSRRFARPVPEKEPDRLSKLEYISAMAELQQRTRAYDLAIENIYADFRRRVTRLLGLDNASKRHDLAQVIAERTSIEPFEVYQTMSRCEAIIQGEPTNKAETLELAAQLREIEEKLGIKRTPRGRTGK